MTDGLFYVASWPGMPGYGAARRISRGCLAEVDQTVEKWRASGATVKLVSGADAQRGLQEYSKARMVKREDQP